MTLETGTLLTIVGMVGTIIGCTAVLAFKARGIIDSNRNLAGAVRDLNQSFNSHVQESNGRDQQNTREHAMMNRAIDANVEALKSASHRIDRVEKQSDVTDGCAVELKARVAVLEAAQER